MVNFLINRPIAVLMSTIALSVLGGWAFLSLPVSLLPKLDIPQIMVKVSYPGFDTRTIENTITVPLRQKLAQVGGLSDIESESGDGYANIKLRFSHSVKMEYAFIETNEKVDEITSSLPKDLKRPIVIKSLASDIPIYYLSICAKNNSNTKISLLDLSRFTTNVIRRRLEQLREVSLIDIHGIVNNQIVIRPDFHKMQSFNLTYSDISNAITQNNLHFGNLSFSEGYYTYHLKINPIIANYNDIGELEIFNGDVTIKLKDIADIVLQETPPEGLFYHNGLEGISVAIYKHPDARMEETRKNIDLSIEDILNNNPGISITKERDQTELLEFAIDNLKNTLIIGLILSVFLVFTIMKKPKHSVIISISTPISLVISFLGMKMVGITLNIISLSGIIFSIGLMIDNSIIVIDNIIQHHNLCKTRNRGIISGTNEVIRPLISSVLTTCAVFIPLIFLSGLTGALFYDQAMTISISLLVSLTVSIIVIPVLYKVLVNEKLSTDNTSLLQLWYEKTLYNVLIHKKRYLVIFFLFVPLGIFIFMNLKREKFPTIEQSDYLLDINWNEPVSLNENKKRLLSILDLNIDSRSQLYSAYIGASGFKMNKEQQRTSCESRVYIKAENCKDINNFSRRIERHISQKYPSAIVNIVPSKNIFQSIFNPGKDNMLIKLRSTVGEIIDQDFIIKSNLILNNNRITPDISYGTFTEIYEIEIDEKKMIIFDIDREMVLKKLKILFGNYEVDKLISGKISSSILLSESSDNVFNKLQTSKISNRNGIIYPIMSILYIRKAERLSTIYSDNAGEYYKISFNNQNLFDSILTKLKELQKLHTWFEVDLDRSFYEKELLFRELIYILLISLILLYLILAAQFESLLLPFIILIEILFDITGALLILYIFDYSLNIMSALGIIVMCGIIINDSIIKIDTIRSTHASGNSIIDAIQTGGRRRFNPIIMTSITTIFALVPFLLFRGIGVELQAPLALAIIGGMFTGTIVSLYFIPIIYYYFARNNNIEKQIN